MQIRAQLRSPSVRTPRRFAVNQLFDAVAPRSEYWTYTLVSVPRPAVMIEADAPRVSPVGSTNEKSTCLPCCRLGDVAAAGTTLPTTSVHLGSRPRFLAAGGWLQCCWCCPPAGMVADSQCPRTAGWLPSAIRGSLAPPYPMARAALDQAVVVISCAVVPARSIDSIFIVVVFAARRMTALICDLLVVVGGEHRGRSHHAELRQGVPHAPG